MAREYQYAVVDAFASEPLTGNPAAVVLDATGLDDDRMAAIAREFNLSETTFVLPSEVPEAAVRVRWFTPGDEVEMCGHATIGGVHALVESGRFTTLQDDPEAILPIQTAGGILRVRMERLAAGGSDGQAHLVWLELRPPRLTPRSLNLQKLTALLGIDAEALDASLPIMQSQDGDLLVFVRELGRLQTMTPDFGELGRFGRKQRIRGFCLATLDTLSPSIQVQSRFFAPQVGVNEDPVTGSVHGPLATYLVVNELVPMRDHTAAVSCVQSCPSGRAGLVRALVEQRPGEGFGVRIAGQCVTTMRGTLRVS